MKYFEMYQKARNEYRGKLGKINANENLSATGKVNARQDAFAVYQAAINTIAEEYNKTMAEKEESLKFCKEKLREVVMNLDAETIAKQDYLFKGFVSKLAMASNESDFLGSVIDMADGNEMQRRALVNNFSDLLNLAKEFAAKTFSDYASAEIWKDDKNEKADKTHEMRLNAKIDEMELKLKKVYGKTAESLKTEKDLRQEKLASSFANEMTEMKGDVFMIQRLFKQDMPNSSLPEFKMPGEEWTAILKSV